MIPTRLLIALVACLAVPLLLGGVDRTIVDVALVANLLLLCVAITDLLISPTPRRVQVERSVSEVLSVGADNPAVLVFQNRNTRAVEATVHDDAGPLCRTSKLPQTMVLKPWETVSMHYSVQP
ncbi:MAG: hypothetical protein KDA96_10695, partial [Planctomycetaceae bacterium]|nr:hypothetical protein [Planctomycetaceae bacterium]